MNKVNWMQAGGVPLRNDDWQYEQDAIVEAIALLNRGLLGDNYRLYGVNLSFVSGISWTEGAVVLEGEIYRVPAGSLPANLGNNYIEVLVSDEPSGDVVLENGSSANIHKRRVATIASYATPQPITSSRFNITVLLQSLPTKIIDVIAGNNNAFTKAQYFAVGGSTFLSGTLTVDTDGNLYYPLMGSGNIITAISSAGYPNGSWIVVVPNVLGGTSSQIGVSASSSIQTSNNGTYWFNGLEPLFFVRVANKWHLLNRGTEAVSWSNSGIVYEPGVTGALRYIEQPKGWIAVDGYVGKSTSSINELLLTLPAAIRPATMQRLILHGYSLIVGTDNLPIPVTIDVDGTLVIHHSYVTPFTLYLSGIRWPV